MNHIYNDKEYMKLVKHILKDKMFLKLKNIAHHGVSRFSHSLKVSYCSYKVAKKLGLNYKKVATAGLLHDFFITEEGTSYIDKVLFNFHHANIAVENAIKRFNISELEKDIISSHMFPCNLTPPKYLESWVVHMVDKVVATGEHTTTFGYKVKLSVNILILFFFNLLR
jgi:uncharacterized protein